jgi:hypothetical protein
LIICLAIGIPPANHLGPIVMMGATRCDPVTLDILV